MPPSVIEDTWTLAELLDASELDELEGTGQAKRLIARICASLHNEMTHLRWLYTASKSGKTPTPQPVPLDESNWLPRRARPKPIKQTDPKTAPLTNAEAIGQRVSAGFREMFGV